MANKVTGQVTGGDPKRFDDVETVADLRKKMGIPAGYVALVNGEEATDSESLEDYAQVDFSEPSKSGK